MSLLGDKKDLTIGRIGFSLDTFLSGKMGFCYFDGKRYEVLCGTDIRKWAEVLIITLTPQPTVIETLTTFPPLAYQLPAGGYQPVSTQNPLPVTSADQASIAAMRQAILQTVAPGNYKDTPRGIPIFQDGFDYPLASWDGAAAVNGALGWDPSGTGTIARNTAYKFKGVGCLGVTTAAVASAIQRAWKVIPIPKSSRRIGLEVYLAGQTGAENFGSFNFGWRYNSLKKGYYEGYFVEAGPGIGVRVVNEPHYPQTMPEFQGGVDCAAFATNVVWHYAKLVVDLDLRQYVSLTFDSVKKDLSGVSSFDTGIFGAPNANDLLILQLAAYCGPAAVACLSLYDEVVVTSDEP